MCTSSHETVCSEASCSFCDQFTILLESCFQKETCSMGIRLKKALMDNKSLFLKDVHHRSEDFQDIFESFSATIEEPSVKACKICSHAEFSSLDNYLQHLNQHYIDICSLFKKYYVKDPPIPSDSSSPITCPICSHSFERKGEKEEDVKNIRSWVSNHFSECGDPIRVERIDSMAKIPLVNSNQITKIIKCGWCEGSFLHRSALRKHMECCSQKYRTTAAGKDSNGESLAKLLLVLCKDCTECRKYESILDKRDDINGRSQFVKHAFNNHPEKLDNLDMNYEELCYISELLELEIANVCQEDETAMDQQSPCDNSSKESAVSAKSPSKYTCIFCEDNSPVFKNSRGLISHYARIHYKSQLVPQHLKTFPCVCSETYCNTTLENEQDAAIHFGLFHSFLSTFMLNDTDNPKVQDEALKIFSLKKSTSARNYKCPICSHTSASIASRLRHLCRHFKIEIMKKMPSNEKFICEWENNGSPCGFVSKNPFGYVIHVGVTHRILDDILNAKGLSLEELKKPVDVEVNQCSICKEIFASRENILLHTCNSIFDKESQMSSGSRKKKTNQSVYNSSSFSDVSEDDMSQSKDSLQCSFSSTEQLSRHCSETLQNDE